MGAKGCRILMRNGASRQTHDAQATHLIGAHGRRVEKRRDHEHIPGATVKWLLRIVYGMEALPFVQQQYSRFGGQSPPGLVEFHDLNIVISRVFVVK